MTISPQRILDFHVISKVLAVDTEAHPPNRIPVSPDCRKLFCQKHVVSSRSGSHRFCNSLSRSGPALTSTPALPKESKYRSRRRHL